MGKQSKITRSARGQDCKVRIEGVCNHNPETTVAAHLNGGGLSMKANDAFIAYACSDCHTWLDGGYVKTSNRNERDLRHLQAMTRTQQILIDEELLRLV